MKEIKAYLRPHMSDAVVDAVEAHPKGPGVTITEVRGFGHPKGGGPAQLTRRIKVEIVVPDEDVNKIIETIVEAARTGRFGDGKVFISDVDEAIRIRTGEQGEAAIRFPEEDPSN